ncbi:MAG: beta-ketoacyl-ACP synthase II, partial [Candidatus Margulisiibacteriota bacterium]
MEKRVVVTGIGVLAPNGIGRQTFWKALRDGKSGIANVTRFDASDYRSRIAGEVLIDPHKFLDHKRAKRLSFFSQMAIICAKEAMADSGLDLAKLAPEDLGVVIGTAAGGMDRAEEQHNIMRDKGLARVDPYFTAAMIPNAATGEISLEFGARGVSITISTACSSGMNAIGYAYDCIRNSRADVIIAGGSESPVTPLTFGAFSIAHQLSATNDFPEEASRPFERDRDGMVLSEGAGILILEELKHALSRDANIYAEVVGYGVTSDAYSMQTLDPAGGSAGRAIEIALKMARLNADDIDYICAHAIGSHRGDRKEINAVKRSLKEHAYKTPISSIKSMTGHPFGAAGALQAVAALMTISTGVISPTINFELSDPDCDLDCVPNTARQAAVKTVLMNSFGLGGNNA